jgi:hypothetical protein
METHDEWITRMYKPERLAGRGAAYEQAVRKSHKDDLDKFGYDFISRHDSITGYMEYYPETCHAAQQPKG